MPGIDAAGSGTSSSGSSTDGANTAVVGSNGVSVALIGLANAARQGFVTVVVPAGTATSGNGLVVPLPTEMLAATPAARSEVRVTQADGRPIPSWIRYSAEDHSLVVGAVPDGAYPLRLLVTVGNQQTVLQISEAATK
jgi:hypothetical protein